MHNPTEVFEVYVASLIVPYMGNGLIYDSPLVQDVLGGDTSPRSYAFLESENKTSTESCSEVPLFNANIYNYAFLSQGYEKTVNDTAYYSTLLNELELVTVVVDCSFTQLKLGDTSAVRVFNLLRSREDHSALYVATVSLSVQDYRVRAHKKSGPALLGMLTFVSDMRLLSTERFYVVAPAYLSQRNLEFEVYEFAGITDGSYMKLRNIPRDPHTESVDYLTTAREHGFYDGDDQSNIRYMYFLLEPDAVRSMAIWEWLGEPVLADSWDWVHGVHLIFAMETVFSLIVLFLVIVVAIISTLIRERIPPSIAIFLFEIIHKHRLVFIRICPPVLREIVNYSNNVFSLGGAMVKSSAATTNSLHFSTAFPIPKKDDLFLAASFFPKISMLGMIIVYALSRKLYWRLYPEDPRQRSDRSTNASAALELKGSLTNFELSTGAELRTRFGLISDYRNYVYLKGMKFASADGVYCSGYVVVHGRYLLRSEDLPAVAMMKLTGARLTNVHVYEVDGFAVKNTARLVYPDTFLWDELWRLNVSVLL
ncbi:unnamed protein product [Phytophthora fragariaefolia]|uniref:Unnamed protein product n=1 Tax=Phytophthora fragariaefolia TaxID=1490495 RepID=A0A9W7CZ59_9STRA|nr:unnamed protein product [Phytophthora fragariaefolia]